MRSALSPLLFSSFVLAVAGCGGDDKTAEKVQQQSIADEKRAFRTTLVSDRDVRSADAGVERSFLKYWSDVQYQSWVDAAQAYDAALLRDLGTATVIEALKSQATFFRAAKPLDITIRRSERGRRTLRYFVKNSGGKLEPRSMVWTRRGSQWRIFYDPYLDDALRVGATSTKQNTGFPDRKEIAGPARAAGTRASQRQSESAERRLARDRRAAQRRQAPPQSEEPSSTSPQQEP